LPIKGKRLSQGGKILHFLGEQQFKQGRNLQGTEGYGHAHPHIGIVVEDKMNFPIMRMGQLPQSDNIMIQNRNTRKNDTVKHNTRQAIISVEQPNNILIEGNGLNWLKYEVDLFERHDKKYPSSFSTGHMLKNLLDTYEKTFENE